MSRADVEAIRKGRLSSYASDVLLLISGYYAEQEVRKNYAGRPMLELLQNAEDAMRRADKPGGVLIRLQANRLIVANQGQPFSLRGLEDICTSHLSEKWRQAYYIGNKGLGFRSVLNWAKTVEIHSGQFHVVLDAALTQGAIREQIPSEDLRRLEAERDWTIEQVPALTMPFWRGPEQDVVTLIRGGWDTVLVLAVTDEALQQVRRSLSSFDATELVFLNYISGVTLEVDDVAREIGVDRSVANRLKISDSNTVMSFGLYRRHLPGIRPADLRSQGTQM